MTPLRRIRQARGMTVEALAEKAGVSPSLIIKRERLTGGSCRLDTARKIAAALECSIDQLWPEVGK